MDSNLLARIHGISVMLFLLTYVIKTILLFTSKDMLANYSKKTKVPEMIISTLFLVTGIWLFVIVGGIKTLYIIKLVFVFLSIPIAIVAFKKQNKGLALLSLVLIVGAYGMAEAGKNKPFIPAKVALSGNATAENSTGAKLYFENCAFCHGADGKKVFGVAYFGGGVPFKAHAGIGLRHAAAIVDDLQERFSRIPNDQF